MATPTALPFRAVIVETDTIGGQRTVGSVREAAEGLVANWPRDARGQRYVNAVEAAYAALDGRLEAETSPKAFICAAKEAGLFVREER
jgi:hypothetical protein